MPSWTIDRVESPVVVYWRVEVGYRCDATFSTELKTRLSQANKLNVAVALWPIGRLCRNGRFPFR